MRHTQVGEKGKANTFLSLHKYPRIILGLLLLSICALPQLIRMSPCEIKENKQNTVLHLISCQGIWIMLCKLSDQMSFLREPASVQLCLVFSFFL